MAMMEGVAPIVNALGLHARPAAEFVKCAGRYRSNVMVRKDALAVNGKSIMGMMMLAAECGSSLHIRADGIWLRRECCSNSERNCTCAWRQFWKVNCSGTAGTDSGRTVAGISAHHRASPGG